MSAGWVGAAVRVLRSSSAPAGGLLTMRRPKAFLSAVFALCVFVVPARPALGQDIEAAARARGIELPRAYYERVAEQPDFFEIKGGWIARAVRAGVEKGVALTGTLPLVVVPALFADSPEPYVSSEQIQAALFDGPSDYGTVHEYFAEVSGGRLNVVGQTLPWVRTTITLAEATGNSYGLGSDARVGDYLIEALAAADPLVDFGAFDNDGPDGIPNSGDDDGQVDAVVFQFLEVAASCGGPGIWPHRSRIQYLNDNEPFVTADLQPNGQPIVLNDYTVQSAVDCGGVEVQKATTVSHELGHVLGLPDLYDRSQGLLPEERRWVVGCWSLMAAGAWGCGTMNREAWVRPTHMGAWEKSRLGWLSHLETVGEVLGKTYSLAPVQHGEHVLKVPLEPWAVPDSAEYLLVEYRTREGFDQDLPASGVLVYHVDPKIRTNRPCDTCPQLYRVALLEADGNNTLRLTFPEGGNRGEPGDAWGVNGPGSLTRSTYPSTRLNSGAESPVTIYEIRLEGGTARVTLSSRVLPAERLLQPLLQSSAAPLTPEEESYLDEHGNGNGRYDVGDLRAYWRR